MNYKHMFPRVSRYWRVSDITGLGCIYGKQLSNVNVIRDECGDDASLWKTIWMEPQFEFVPTQNLYWRLLVLHVGYYNK